MSGLPRTIRGRSPAALLRPASLAALAVAAVFSGGCASLHCLCSGLEQAPTGPACKVVTRWETHLVETQDSVNGGAPLRGLAGRLYLFGPDLPTGDVNPPLRGDGEVIVDLYDDRPLLTGGAPVALERWQFPPEVLKMLLRKDLIGWGYTLFLPWGKSYRPDITQVHLRLAYVVHGSAPLYFVSSTINLTPPETAAAMALASARMPAPGPQAAPRPPYPVVSPQVPLQQGNMPAPVPQYPQPNAQMPMAVPGMPSAPPAVTPQTPPQVVPPALPPPAEALPKMPEPVRIPIRPNVPLPAPAAPQTAAPPPVPTSQPVQPASWIGVAKQ